MIVVMDAGVLDGVVVPVKNCIRVRGYVLTSGTKYRSATLSRSTFDSPGIARLRAAGLLPTACMLC